MSDKTAELLITNLPAILTALGVMLVAYLNYRTNQLARVAAEKSTAAVDQSKANAAKIEANTVKIEEVHKSTNGALEKLLEATRESSKAEGVLDEKTRQESSQ